MSFNYTTGLNNMGSFQVSGRPWLKGITFSGTQSKFYEFPNVTDHVHIVNDHAAAGNALDIVFCEPRRAMDFGGTSEYLSATLASSIDQLTVSVWIKLNEAIADIKSKWLIEVLGGNGIRIQTTGTPKLRFRVDGTNQDDTTTTLTSGPWINLTITANGTNNHLYLNGSLLKSNSANAGTGFTGIALGGAGSTGYDGIYDEAVLFDTAFTAAEVSELYNAGATMLPREHSKASNLVSHWQFEDNSYKTFNTTPDTTATIYDRVSSNNFGILGGATAMTFVDGRLLENALSHHAITLKGQQEIRLNCKCKQIFLKSNGDTEVSLIAGLTNIPSERMYLLTGPGIDD